MRRNAIWHAAVLVASLASCQTASPWVGRKFMAKCGQELKVGNQIVDDGSTFRVYKVERVNGDWLWLVSGSVSGWVRSGNVVPFDRAIHFYRQVIRLKPNSPAAYNSRGLLWAEKKEYDIAVGDYTEAIRFDPKQVAVYNRGNAWEGKKEYDRAIADYNEAFRIDPKQITTRYGF